MLEGILGRGGFSGKCKALIKQTKNRIEVIGRKRNATLKFLKKDVADLLANGLDINAYGRAEGLLSELLLSSCYDFVQHSGDFVLKHLSVMQKLRHCPEDCREAVASLMFAAARFSDLPELRDLRQTFYERYGNSLELFVNQEFIDNLSPKPFTMEKKVKLMQDIAAEYSISWDSRGFEQRMSRPPATVQNQQKSHRSLHGNEDKYKSTNGRDCIPNVNTLGLSSKERFENTNEGCGLINEENKASHRNEFNPGYRDLVSKNRHKSTTVADETSLKSENHATPSKFRREVSVEKHEPWREETPSKPIRHPSTSQRKGNGVDGAPQLHDGRGNMLPKKGYQDDLVQKKPDVARYAGMQSMKNDGKHFLPHNTSGGQNRVAVPRIDVQEKAIQDLKPLCNNGIPPPYTKSSSKPKGDKCGASLAPPNDDVGSGATAKLFSRDNHVDAGDWSHKSHQAVHHRPESEGPNVEPSRTNGHTVEYYQDKNLIPKPRSSRKKHSNSHSSHGDVGYAEDTEAVKRRSRSRRRREDSRKGLQVLFDDEHSKNDEEERIIDRLLMHYSTKPSASESGKGKRKPRSRHSHHQGGVAGESSQNVFVEGEANEISEVNAPPRSISLPREQTAPPEVKVFTRAASFQPDRSSPARHVHPKLPDYDDLAARFAALKGR